MIHFVEIILLLLLATAALGGAFTRLFRNDNTPAAPLEILIFALGLAPVGYSFILYLLMLFLPGRLAAWHLLTACSGFYLLLLCWCWNYAAEWGKGVRQQIGGFADRLGIPRRVLVICAISAGAVIAALLAFNSVNPIRNFDMVEYMLCGELFAGSRVVAYDGLLIDPENGFLYRAFHSYIFPLFGTMGTFLTELFGCPQDMFFKHICFHYFLTLNLAGACYLLSRVRERHELYLALGVMLMFNTMPVTADFLYFYGIDFFRCTLLLLMLWSLSRYLIKPGFAGGVMLTLCCSAVVLSHGIHLFIAGTFMAALFFAAGDWKTRFKSVAFIGCGVLLLGLSHYIMATFWGDGWIFGIGGGSNGGGGQSVGYNLSSYTEKVDWAQIFYGFLGQLFNIPMFSFCFLFIIAGLILLIKRRKEFPVQWYLPAAAVLFWMVIIGWRFFYNYRYQYTFLPVLIFVAGALMLNGYLSAKWCKVMVVVTLFSALAGLGFIGGYAGELLLKKTVPAAAVTDNKIDTAEIADSTLNAKTPWEAVAKNGGDKILFLAKNKMLYRETPWPMAYCYAVALQSCAIVHTDGKMEVVRDKDVDRLILHKFDAIIIHRNSADQREYANIIKQIETRGVLIYKDEVCSVYRPGQR